MSMTTTTRLSITGPRKVDFLYHYYWMSNCGILWHFGEQRCFRCSRERASVVETRRLRLSGRQLLHERRNSVVLYKLAWAYIRRWNGTLLSTEYFSILVQDVALPDEHLLCVRLALRGASVQRLSPRTSNT